jgi:hypothetical protein
MYFLYTYVYETLNSDKVILRRVVGEEEEQRRGITKPRYIVRTYENVTAKLPIQLLYTNKSV